ncbi:hypothetical protein ROHU_008482 [Labeo rohita]|uniref:Uncharacterized protein n=1 Tax=Labeo rohita TaxID=84645 RepID=A0A498MEV2_LABRO|nr:hypothetical protein ROHU_008482 [Labeo rohita]
MREGLASYEERTSTPVLQSRQKERERTTHELELRGTMEHREEEETGELYSRQRLAEMLKEMEDSYKREVTAPEDLESCQTEEPEAAAEGTVTPADTFLETLNEMKERANKTRERIQESLDLLKQKLEESEIDYEPLLLRPSPRKYVQKKKYKQVSGTLLLQDVRYPDDSFQSPSSTKTKNRRGTHARKGEQNKLKQENCPKMKCCLQTQNRKDRERLILVLVLVYLLTQLPKIQGNPQTPLSQDPLLVPKPDIHLMNSSHLIQLPSLTYFFDMTEEIPGIYANKHPKKRSMLASAATKQMINVSVKPSGVDIGCTSVHTVGPGLDELDEIV